MFGVNCEALPRQVNFLTDEAGECSKGVNVVSHLHYFLETHGLGEKVAFMSITALAKMKAVAWCSIWRRGLLLIGTHPSHVRSW